MPKHFKQTLESGGLTKEQVETGGVVLSFGARAELVNPLPVTYKTLRALRKDPTIALARAVTVGPAVLGEWSVESKEDTDDDIVAFAKEQMLPIRAQLMEDGLYGGMDFGWQGWEVIYKVIERGDYTGQIGLRKIKPLLPDLTTILVERDGSFAGFFQERDNVVVPLVVSLLISHRVEGTQWHGQSLLENARETADMWKEANEGASRYDKKIAGSHWIIHYPIGSSPVTTVDTSKKTTGDGQIKDNRDIAADILAAMESSGSTCIPHMLGDEADEWKVELISDGAAKQISFVSRLEYLDAQKVRALLLPERSVLEGRFGTKAEAETHTDIAVVVMQMAIERVTNMVSWHVLDKLIAMNYGDDAVGSVWLAASPLADSQIEFIRSVYLEIIKNGQTIQSELPTIDTGAIKDQVGIPVTGVDPAEIGDPMADITLPGDEDDDRSRQRAQIAVSMSNIYQSVHKDLMSANGK